ncbi:MAG: hypothetical protein ACP5G4_07470, partial [bacterium]
MKSDTRNNTAGKKPKSKLYRNLCIPAIIAVATAVMLTPYFRFSAVEIAKSGLFIDDAYFYTVLARNFRNLGHLTLDGEMITNGVQPLWMGFQILLGYIFPNADGVVLLARSSSVIYILFAFVLIWLINRKPGWGGLTVIAAVSFFIVLNGEFHKWVLKGLETPIALLMIVLTFLVFDTYRKKLLSAEKRAFLPMSILLGFLSAMVFFARTDMFWVAVVIFGWMLITERRISWNIAAFSSIIAVLVIPYLFFNLSTADGLMPISGRVKLFYLESTFPSFADYFMANQWSGMFNLFDWVFAFKYLPGGIFPRYVLIFLAIGLSLYFLFRFRKEKIYPPWLNLLAATVLFHILFMHLVYKELRDYSAYYFATEALYYALFLGYSAKALLERASETSSPRKLLSKAFGMRVLAIAILLWAAVDFSGRLVKRDISEDSYWSGRLELAGDISRMVPEGEKVGAFWPGLFAHFSGRDIAPLDGIIGSADYFENYVKQGRELH